MRKKVWIGTPYGRVPVEVLECDLCHAQEAEATAIGWLEVATVGITVKTLGSEPLPAQTFCSAAHAISVLERMANE